MKSFTVLHRRSALNNNKPEVATMWMTRARSVFSVVLLGAAATLGSVGSAQAAIYAGRWDPAYGGNFPSLGWEASALFDVPEACLAMGNTTLPIAACPGFDVLSARVDLYNAADPLQTTLQSFNLNPDVIVSGITIAGNQLAGVDTFPFDYFVPTLNIAGSGAYSFSLVLYGGNLAQLIHAQPITTSPTCANPLTPVQGASCGVSANPAVGVFTAVAAIPEPETYALMLAGLGAIGFVARRRRR